MKKRVKKTKELLRPIIVPMGIALLLPIIVVIITNIFPEKQDHTTQIFLAISAALYVFALILSSKILTIREELKECNKELEVSNDFISLVKTLEDSKYKYISKVFKQYKNTLRPIKEITASGEAKSVYYSTVDAESYFDEENMIYRNIPNKTINYITQALTGIGIFGTFMGIVQGVSELKMDTSEEMRVGIETLLSGIKMSFNSSLYGILFSVILTFVLKLMIDWTMKEAVKVIDKINICISSNTKQEGLKELETELKSQTASLQRLSTDLAEEMGKKFDESMQANLSKLAEDMGTFINELQSSFSKTVSENAMSTNLSIAATISPVMERLEQAISKMQEKQENTSNDFMKQSIDSIKEAINIGTSGEINRLKDSMDLISEKNSEVLTTFTESMENMKNLTKYQEGLIKNTTESTENMNITTDNIKSLQDGLSNVIVSLKEVGTSNNSSLENINATVNSLKDSMSKQSEINISLNEMINRTLKLSENQENYIHRFNKISDIMSNNIENVETNMSKVNDNMASFSSQMRSIKDSTLEVVTVLDDRFIGLTNNLETVNTSLVGTINSIDSSILIKVEDMGSKMHKLTGDLTALTSKTQQLTEKIGMFAEVESSTQDLWVNYKGSFENLNTTITDGVENYTKLVSGSVNDLFKQYDSSIANAVTELKKMVESINEGVEDITEALEPLEFINKNK